MSLYHEAARFVHSTSAQPGSLQSRIFSSKGLKNAPKQVFALVIEVSKWSEVLSEVIENSQLLQKHTAPEEKVLYIDRHIPNLIALAPQTNLVDTDAYRSGLIILQDKASCFPAYMLNPKLEEGPCLDACAAPGNKTTHLAAITQNSNMLGKRGKIWACERDFSRSKTLRRMVAIAGANQFVAVKAGQDFLSLDPTKSPWNQVAFLLLDPSCSGSGIVGRDNIEVIALPRDESGTPTPSKKRKRKRDGTNVSSTSEGEKQSLSPQQEQSKIATRLTALAAFQSKLLKHAFSFPRARKITYSTCSIHAEENELVVAEVLESMAAQQGQWRLLRRHEQIAEMRDWHIRGNPDSFSQAMTGKPLNFKDSADACLRCEKGTEDGTQGFFVATFVKSTDTNTTINTRDETKGTFVSLDTIGKDEEIDDQEWEGLSET
ncbi:MAG: hypothetical protein Q9167_006936 [Letrouitia subvulpina]